MKTLTAATILTAILAAGSAGAQGAAGRGVLGDWKTEGGDATVRIAPCPGNANTVCGNFVGFKGGGANARDAKNPNPALRSRPLIGMPFVTNFKPAGANRWNGGKIYNPQDGKTYNSKMALNPNGALTVNGCVLVVCQGQTWTRAN